MAEAKKRKPPTKPKLTDKEQSERFREAARMLGVQENDNFENVLRKIALSKETKIRKI